jgi:hypothetical protein
MVEYLASQICLAAVRGGITDVSVSKSNSGRYQQTIKVRNAVEGTGQLGC